MKRELPLLLLILGVHLGLGYLYQLSNGIICFTELSFLAVGGILFWGALYQPLKRLTTKMIGKDALTNRSLLGLSGIGLLTSILNLFFCQLFLITCFGFLFNCESPSFNTLTASLTNNVAGNLLCYAALITTFVQNREWPPLEVASQDFAILESRYILLQLQNASVKVLLRDISHVTVSHNAITVHTKERRYVKYQSLKAFQEELKCSKFQRVHRSTLVNMAQVLEVRPNANGDGTLLLNNGEKIRFSRAYKASMLAHFQEPST